MILPTKHIAVEDSLLGAGAIILQELARPQTVSRLWDRLRTNPTINNFNRFSLALDFLFAIGAIELSNDLIKRMENKL